MKSLLSLMGSLYIITTSPVRWRLLSLYVTLTAKMAWVSAFVRAVYTESVKRLIQRRK